MKKKHLSQNEMRRARADKAMPEVKKLVRKFGRTAISNCLIRLHEYEKSVERLQSLKSEVVKLEKELN
jgi:ribosomal protein S20